MRAEYKRTNNKVIAKGRFPALLMELWETDAIKAKTNIIKSFIKAGVFPFNPKAIDRSRILKNSTSINTSSSNTFSNTSDTSNIDLTSNPSTSSSYRTLDESNHAIHIDQPITNIISSPQLRISSFSSSQEAISALDRVLQETKSYDSNDDNDDDDEDEDYLPNKSISTSSTTVLSMAKEKPSSKILPAIENDQSMLSRRGIKRKKRAVEVIGFETSDDEGIIL